MFVPRTALSINTINPSNAEANVQKGKYFENHPNPVMLVLIGKLSLSTLI